MKTLVLIIALVAAPLVRAQLLTLDVANLSQSVAQYGALISQISNQATQISNQVQQIQQLSSQIQQFGTHLSRMGDMAALKNLIGLTQLKFDLSLPSQLENWDDGLKKVDGLNILGDTRGGLFESITATFEDFDGASVARDADLYKSAEAITVTVDNFKDVQKDVFTRRAELKEAIEVTTEAVRNAATVAEETKQQAILEAQYDQLASLDSEIQLSASEIQAKVAEGNAMAEAQDKAEAETRSHTNQQESAKIGKAFKPYYGCMLQYVNEKRFKP